MSLLFGFSVGRSLVAVLSVLFFSFLVVGLIWAFFRRASLSAYRELPRMAAVGELLVYEVVVRNEGDRVLRDVSLCEEGDDPRPSEWEFLNLRESGEERRNWFDRVFAFYRWKWLNDRGGRWRRQGSSEPFVLGAGETGRVSLSLMPRRRGVICLEDLRAELPDPLGLFQRRCGVLGEADQLLVMPRCYRLAGLRMGERSGLEAGSDGAFDQRGEGGEFMGLREYREGDSLRRVHWKAWARTGQPIVKEFEEVRFPRYGLVLDTNLRASGRSFFEEAVSVAASFVSSFEGESCLLDFLLMGDELEMFTVGRGKVRTEHLMEVLAKVEGSDGGGYGALGALLSRGASEMRACVVVLCGWCNEREVFLRGLQAAGLELRVYVVGAGERSGELPVGVHWLRVGHVQEDLLGG